MFLPSLDLDDDDSDEDEDSDAQSDNEENDGEPVAKKSKMIEEQAIPTEVFGGLKNDE